MSSVVVVLLSIYKMFPADKKRVESALAAAHLPKGKVRGSGLGGEELLMEPYVTLCHPNVIPWLYLFPLLGFPRQYDTIKPDVFTEAAFKIFLMNLCPRPEIYEIFST